MAGIITFGTKTNLSIIREQYRYTVARLKSHRWTSALGNTFAAFAPRLAAIEGEEQGLLMQLEECDAAMEFLDVELDDVVDMVAGVTGNRRGPGLYRELFGNKRVFEFKRPILHEQLDAMIDWQEILDGRADPVLNLAHQKLAALIPKAIEAQTNKKSIQARLVTFRETGGRAVFIDEFNALRKSCFGELSKLQHEHKQDSRWAESFFMQRANSQLTILDVERQLAAHAEEGAYLQALHQELIAKQEAAEEAARLAEERAKQADIAGKREQLARLAAELAALEGNG